MSRASEGGAESAPYGDDTAQQQQQQQQQPPPAEEGDAASPNAAASPTRRNADEAEIPEHIRIIQSLSTEERDPGITTNFATMMTKNMRLKGRGCASTCLETFLPILFILGLVGIWAAVSEGTVDEKHFVSDTAAVGVTDYAALAYNAACTRSSAPIVFGIRQCTAAEENRTSTSSDQLECYDSGNQEYGRPPIAGLCTTGPGLSIVLGWLQNRAPRFIPTMDEMIMMQWIANATVSYRLEDNSYQQPLSAIANGGFLHFAPDTPAVRGLVAHLNTTSSLFRHAFGRIFTTASEAVSYSVSLDQADKNWGVVEVAHFDVANGMDITIHLNRSGVPWTNRVTRVGNGIGRFMTANYLASGFLTLQDVVSRYYMTSVALTPEPPRTVHIPMGYEAYDTSSFLSIVGQLAALFLVFGYLYPVSQLVKRIVDEKEQKVREAMMIMGLTTAPFYASWIVTYFIFQVVTALVAAILLKATMLPKSDFFIMFLLYLLFGFSNVTLAGAISSFFSKARVAALVAPVLFFLFAIPSFALPDTTPAGLLILLSLMSPTGFANGMKVLVDQEISGGMTWASLNKSFNGYPMSAVFVMLALDTALYMLLTLYLDAVLPSEWGTSSHPCFCFINPFRAWKRSRETAADEEMKDGRDEAGVFEPTTPGKKPSVELRGMRKEFILPSGELFVAVNDLTFNMYENQVFALLGHNGAGKTTAMNCMTGMLDMDGGDCLFHGHSVKHDLAGVRREIGYCPQHNILWPELTCREHLAFFARLKGLPADMRDGAVEAMLKAVDLEEKGDKFPHELSGGQKRKLSVGIAFVGGSKVVFLDEPTAGMDVAARRHTWELIKLMTKGRTIVLTTHFMDEADLLGDTVAIMAKGRLKAAGSSLFLKNRLGVGYTLSIACQSGTHNGAIIDAVKQFVPSMDVLSNGGGEVGLRLPMDAVPAFPAMLSHLEDHGKELGIRGHGISVTTLEEVFLKIGHDDEAAAEVAKANAATDAAKIRRENDVTSEEDVKVIVESEDDASKKLMWNDDIAAAKSTPGMQMGVLMTKRFHYAKRDTRTIVMQIVLPVICITFAMLLTLIKFPDSPAFAVGDYGQYTGASDLAYAGCPSDWASFTPRGIPAVEAPSTYAGSFSRYLVANARKHADNRLGAHMCQNPGMYGSMPASQPNTTIAIGPVQNTSVIFTNNSIYVHSGPHALWELQATWIRRGANDVTRNVRVANHPLPLSTYEQAFVDAITTVFVAIFVLIPFTFIPSTFVSFIVKEREVHALQLQQASGLMYVVYWVANFFFDVLSFFVTAILAIVIFAIFSREEYTGTAEVFFATFVLLMLYGAAGVAGAYICSFFFDSHSTAQNIVLLVNFICGFLLVLAAYILSIIESTKDAGEGLRYVFRIVPSYCLGEGILNLATRQLLESFGEKKGAFDMDVCGWPMLYMGLEFPIFMAIVLYLDSPLRREQVHNLGEADRDDVTNADDVAEDEDVAEERRIVESGERDATDHVSVKGLRKYFPSNGGVLAVKDLSFGVHKGEVFGFLGTNGAGKSTTISILCGELMPTRGVCTIDGHDVVQEAALTRSLIGYCPQFDALHDLLTVTEHLDLYAGLHGLMGPLGTDVKERLIAVCGLEEHRVKEARSLSGGNKRKLSVAISLLGAPQVVFLDEPSAGMDPMARRQMWGLIEQVAEHCSVVLTTHHLEEIEALASRTAIMVKGEMKCIGSLQHLKSKFGSGFEMSVRVKREDLVAGLKSFVDASLAEAALQEENGTKLTYQLPQSTKLSAVFSAVQAQRDELGITDYSVSQTSLESVFLRISGDAESDE